MEEPLASTSTLCPDCPSSSFVGWECGAAECEIKEDCCEECCDGDGESVAMECCDSFDCLLPSPALSATRSPPSAHGHAVYKPLQYAEGLALDCNQCSESTATNPERHQYRPSGTVTPLEAVQLSSAPVSGLGELLGALDGNVIEEIVSHSVVVFARRPLTE